MLVLAQLGSWVHAAAGVATWDGPRAGVWGFSSNRATRTGGPDDDDDEAALVRKLMPIMATVIVLAVVFGG